MSSNYLKYRLKLCLIVITGNMLEIHCKKHMLVNLCYGCSPGCIDILVADIGHFLYSLCTKCDTNRNALAICLSKVQPA